MNFSIGKKWLGALLLALLLGACGGGGSTGTSPATNHQMGGAWQGIPLNLTKTVSSIAGASQGADGTGAAARFNQPYASVSDGTSLYVTDASNHTIRKIVIASGEVTTLAGTVGTAGSADGTGTAASFNLPVGITLAGGNLYVADGSNHTIRQIVIASGVVTTLAGTASVLGGTSDGTGTAAGFKALSGISTDGSNLYVLDYNTIRKIAPLSGTLSAMTSANAVVTTLAGMAGTPGSVDATGSAARFGYPSGITTDNTSLYVADLSNNTIRKVAPLSGTLSAMTSANAVVTTLAGTTWSLATPGGSTDGSGTAALFNEPSDITTDGSNLYVTDTYNETIRKIAPASGTLSAMTSANAVVTTLAGTALATGSADGIGTAARFNYPLGITADNTNLYVMDQGDNTIRKITPSSGALSVMTSANAAVTTLAGSAAALDSTDGAGTMARFNTPSGITTDGINLYVTDTPNNTIRKIVISTGVVTTFAGTAGTVGLVDATGTAARFNQPAGITTDGSNLYVAETINNTIRKIVISSGVVTTLAGAGTGGSLDGLGTVATFSGPTGITTDGSNLYVSDGYNRTIRKIVIASGVVSTLAGTAGVQGSVDAIGTAATFSLPDGITTDGSNLFVADRYNHTIRKIVISSGVVSTLAGTALATGTVDGIGTAARFIQPAGITTDGSNLYVADYSNNTIRKIVIASGVVTTLAGTAGVTGAADATGTAATFFNPSGITSDGSSLFVTDSGNGTIRKIQ